MWVVAIVADVISLIPIPIIGGAMGDLVAWIGFSIIGADINKGGLFSEKQLGVTLVTMGLEFILGMVPFWTARVIIYKWQTRNIEPAKFMEGGWDQPDQNQSW